jgi:hypothetical protein
MFLALRVGTAEVKATAEGTTSYPLRMHVSPRVAVHRFPVRQAAVQVGDTISIPYVVTDATGAPLPPDFPVGIWPTNSPVGYARVISVGVHPGGRTARVVGVQAGTTWLVARLGVTPMTRPPGDSIPVSVVPRP